MKIEIQDHVAAAFAVCIVVAIIVAGVATSIILPFVHIHIG